jgi:hypothetical protein
LGRERAREAVALAAREQLETHQAVALQHLAAVVVLRPPGEVDGSSERFLRAARLIGYIDASVVRLDFRRNPGEQQLYEKVMRALTLAIGSPEVARLGAEGAAWADERAVAEGLAI